MPSKTPISISAQFAFTVPQPTDIMLQFEAAVIPEQRVLSAQTSLSPSDHCARVAAADDIGERILLKTTGGTPGGLGTRFDVRYDAQVELDRRTPDLAMLGQMPPHLMPGGAVHYMFPSCYVPSARFQTWVEDEYGHLSGGAKILAMRDWIADKFDYVPGASGLDTTGENSFVDRRGVCRDYAHVMVMLARAAAIPARYVSCYAPGVNPPDFHAVAEVFLADGADGKAGGSWHLVDATRMAGPADIVKIGVGRDAADVSFMTSFGMSEFLFSEVTVTG